MFARTLLAALLVASVAFPVKAQAYDFLKSPSGRVASVSQREIVFRLPAQVPEGLTKEEVRAAVERALQRWSEASGLVLRVAEGVADAPTGCASEGMRVNDIVFVQRGWKRMGGAVAETPVCIGDSTGNIYGADILLNASDYKFAVLDADHPTAIGAFDLEAVLRWGSIPLVWASGDKDETLRAYVQTYLKEEIRAEGLVRNLPGFARFLPVAAVLHGQTINVAGAARDAEVGRNTLGGYFDILEDTLLAFRLPAYEAGLRVRERKHPKLYWVDPGLARAAGGRHGALHPQEKGPLLEGLVASILRACSDYSRLFDGFYYWASASGRDSEVDFLLERQGAYVAIEVKASGKMLDGHLKGLRACRRLAGLKKRILVYLGERTLRSPDGIDVWPFSRFAANLTAAGLWGP